VPAPPPPPEYRWKPGQSGNPGGRPKKKPFTEELTEALTEVDDQGKSSLRAVVERCIVEAESGSYPHLREIIEHIQGKSAEGNLGPDEPDRPRRIIIPDADERFTPREG
jgi:hypothetical protein